MTAMGTTDIPFNPPYPTSPIERLAQGLPGFPRYRVVYWRTMDVPFSRETIRTFVTGLPNKQIGQSIAIALQNQFEDVVTARVEEE